MADCASTGLYGSGGNSRFFLRFHGLARRLKGAGGVFVGLTREFVSGEAACLVCSSGSGMGVCGKVVIFGGSFVCALRHGVIPLCR